MFFTMMVLLQVFATMLTRLCGLISEPGLRRMYEDVQLLIRVGSPPSSDHVLRKCIVESPSKHKAVGGCALTHHVE